jgi:predicted PurR-regulated permease PerM
MSEEKDLHAEGERIAEAQLEAMSRKWLPVVFFFLVAAFVTWGTALIVAPYIIPILIAAMMVTFTYPWYEKIKEKLGNRETLASFVTLLLLTVVVIVPAVLIAITLIRQATQLFNLLQSADVKQAIDNLHLGSRVQELLARVPGLDVQNLDLGSLLYGAVKGIPGWVAAQGGHLVGGLLNGLVGFVLVLLASFYFFIDGKKIISSLMQLSPLPDKYDRRIIDKIRAVINATFRGQGLTSLAQGLVTGIGLAIVGIPGAVFWGAVAAVFSLVPLVGSAVVWVPAVGYLFWANGLAWQPIFLLIWGALVVSTIDNLVRPLAMKEGMEMPGVVLLFAILGGMRAFGFIGLLLGPLVVALMVSMMGIYRDLFRESLKSESESESVEQV